MNYEHTVISPGAKIADDVEIGAWTTIGPGVEIESGVKIGSNVEIKCNTHIGSNTVIASFASVGGDPQHLGYKGEETALLIGKNNTIREFVTISRGTASGDGITRIGDNNYMMSYAHVAHDCVIGDNNVFANNASCAGHVAVGNNVVLGAFSGIHQFCSIGDYSFLGRATKIYKDILPYVIVVGNPGCPMALNIVGLRRAKFSASDRKAIKNAFNLVFRAGNKLQKITTDLSLLAKDNPVLEPMLEMVVNSERGIARQLHGGHVEPMDAS